MNANVSTAGTTAEASSSARWALLALAIGAFGIGTTEFSPMGLLPVIAQGVDVSIPTAGLLISAYAIGVMVGAPVMTLAFSRFGKRTALMLLMAIFTIGNLMSAMAPGYSTLLLARLVTSMNHGAFFGLGAVVAASVVPKEKQASAVAAMFMGLTIANIGGVPAATWVGQQIGWRMAFAGTALIGIAAIAVLWTALPKGERGAMPDVKRELRVLTRPPVLLAMATTVMGAGAMFTLYTYVAPTLETLTGASDRFVTFGLALIGIGFTIGNWLGGRLADWSLDGATKIFLGALAVIMLVLPLAFGSHAGAVIGLLVWGAAAFAIVPPVQMRVMQAASEAPGLASSINVGAFNLGNALGAAIGAGVISLGLGYAVVAVAGGALAAAGLALVWLGSRKSSALQPCEAQQEKARNMNTTLFPMAGQRFEVDYGGLVAQNVYAEDGRSLTYAITSGALAGNTATVSFEWRRLKGGVFAISWQEADGATVVHIDDFEAGQSLAFFTTADRPFHRLEGPLRSLHGGKG